jgi:hypothetical protein
MPSGFEEFRQRRAAEQGFPDFRDGRPSQGGAMALVKLLVIALCCSLFLALVVLRG